MNRFLLLFLLFPLMLQVSVEALFAQSGNKKVLDQVVAIVNDHTIFKSEVDETVTEYLLQLRQQSRQEVEFSKEMWYAALENMIERYVMLDKAREDSVEISQDIVDRQIDYRIQQAVNQLGSEEALEKQLGKSIVQVRADLRESYREEMIVQRYREQKLSNVSITRPEVEKFFNSIPRDSLPVIPEQLTVSQIVKLPPPLEDARKNAFELASSLRDSIVNHGKDIEELARKYSDGPSAPRGGRLPMMSLNDLVAEYSAAAAALEPGEISKVVETSFGFHVIRLNKRSGDQIDTNHILIHIDSEGYDREAAIAELNALRDSVLKKGASFAGLARTHSDDPNTAPYGGRVLNPRTGERLIPLSQLDPALYRIVLLQENEGDISEPKQFNMDNRERTAYRIVRLDRRIEEHVADLSIDYDRIRDMALQQKQYRVLSKWIQELRNEVYIEYKIRIPEEYKQISL